MTSRPTCEVGQTRSAIRDAIECDVPGRMAAAVRAVRPVNAVLAWSVIVVFTAYDGMLSGADREFAHDVDVGIDPHPVVAADVDDEDPVRPASRAPQAPRAHNRAAQRHLRTVGVRELDGAKRAPIALVWAASRGARGHGQREGCDCGTNGPYAQECVGRPTHS